MLKRHEFETLYACLREEGATLHRISAITGLPLETVVESIDSLCSGGFMDANRRLTENARVEIADYKVDSAIILATGAGTRFAPLSFERPKALFEVRGEVLIERLIRQLCDVGINRIAVVAGYMKESLFYLEDKFGVSIVVNPDYASRNNHASVWHARRYLGNTYIVSSDQYFTENIFCSHRYGPCCTVVESESSSAGFKVAMGHNDYVVGIERGGLGSLVMRGPVYFDSDASRAYLNALEHEYDLPATKGKMWEEVLAEHLCDIPLSVDLVASYTVAEFRFLTDLVAFDTDFFANVDSGILDNICKTLECSREDISDVSPVKAGLTNLSTLFSVRGEKYIYRHPGNGTNELINRRAEAFALGVAKELGLDDTFVYEEPEKGWKISRFIEGCSELDYADAGQVSRALELTRRLHESGRVSPFASTSRRRRIRSWRCSRGCATACPVVSKSSMRGSPHCPTP